MMLLIFAALLPIIIFVARLCSFPKNQVTRFIAITVVLSIFSYASIFITQAITEARTLNLFESGPQRAFHMGFTELKHDYELGDDSEVTRKIDFLSDHWMNIDFLQSSSQSGALPWDQAADQFRQVYVMPSNPGDE